MFLGVIEHLLQTNRETVDLDKMYNTEFNKLKLGLYKLQNIKRKVVPAVVAWIYRALVSFSRQNALAVSS